MAARQSDARCRARYARALCAACYSGYAMRHDAAALLLRRQMLFTRLARCAHAALSLRRHAVACRAHAVRAMRAAPLPPMFMR